MRRALLPLLLLLPLFLMGAASQVFTGASGAWITTPVNGTTSAVRVLSSQPTSTIWSSTGPHMSVKMTNNGPADCFVGPSTSQTGGGVTALTGGVNGSRVAANGGIWPAEFTDQIDVWYICPSGNQTAGTATAPTGSVLEVAK